MKNFSHVTLSKVGSGVLTPGLQGPSGSGDIDINAKSVNITAGGKALLKADDQVRISKKP